MRNNKNMSTQQIMKNIVKINVDSITCTSLFKKSIALLRVMTM